MSETVDTSTEAVELIAERDALSAEVLSLQTSLARADERCARYDATVEALVRVAEAARAARASMGDDHYMNAEAMWLLDAALDALQPGILGGKR